MRPRTTGDVLRGRVGTDARPSVPRGFFGSLGSRSLSATINAFGARQYSPRLTRTALAAQLPLLSGAAPKLAAVYTLCPACQEPSLALRGYANDHPMHAANARCATVLMP